MLRVIACRSSSALTIASKRAFIGGRVASCAYDVGMRWKSTAIADEDQPADSRSRETHRLQHIRNVGILAHVDAGKTTVTERMLALAGVVRRAGCVDMGNTVTDYLPAERERGITIQSAAISFEWGWHNHYVGEDYDANDNVQIHLIDTPGHVDFSVEVNRSVAVLDGAVLVVDAVAGVQAQTETVWRAMTRPSMNNHNSSSQTSEVHGHEPLPCLAMINKMDKEGCNFQNAMDSLTHKLPGANPVAIQLPLFQTRSNANMDNPLGNVVADCDASGTGEFIGVVDLIHMRAVIWPDSPSDLGNVETCIPTVINLLKSGTREPHYPDCQVTQAASAARDECVAALADVDASIEEYFLCEEQPSNAELRMALRRATLSRKVLPVMTGAALRGKGIEPLLDAIADLLPSPLDRMPPALIFEDNDRKSSEDVAIGHPMNSSLLALAFKVVHMKGRGGSGDGRVVFCRVYSGQLRVRDTIQVVSPSALGIPMQKARVERVGGMLELAGGQFDNLEEGFCQSGDVCALVGLKSVVTGDTILQTGEERKKGKSGLVSLAGVASPKPVLTVRLETESSQEHKKMLSCLKLFCIEDPSLHLEETDAATLLSGLGELHIEVTLDRLWREHGIQVRTGSPAVAYRETVSELIETDGLLDYDRTIGATRLQASVHIRLEPLEACEDASSCMILSEPAVTLGRDARIFLNVGDEEDVDDLVAHSDVVSALVSGCLGSLKRGSLGSYAMTNLRCHVMNVDAEGGYAALQQLPGSLRAAAAYAVSAALGENKSSCTILEPVMSMEVTVPGDMVGNVLSDWTSRRGAVGDVITSDGVSTQSKALVRGDVPLIEILGYANRLRSLTGGEGAFTAEYKGHAPCDLALMS